MLNDEKLKELEDRPYYNVRSLLGNDLMMFYFLIGGRCSGKSYSVLDHFLRQWKRYKRPFYWLRLTDTSAKKLLQNNADKLIDPDLRRKYNIETYTNGLNVYDIKRDKKGKIIKKELMCKVLDCKTFYNDKGSGHYDKDFLNNPNMYYNICLDEMNREASEKNDFDIVYGFANQLENLVRKTKARLRIICIGNTLAEASDLLSKFGFQPREFGRYYLIKNKKKLREYLNLSLINYLDMTAEQKKRFKELSKVDYGKRAVIEYMPETNAYKTVSKNSASDILAGDSSTFTNKVELDTKLITKMRLVAPNLVIRFSKSKSNWYTIWNGKIIAKYNGEQCNRHIAMRPYLDIGYSPTDKKNIIDVFDSNGFYFKDLNTQVEFKHDLQGLRKG